ncbi:MAG TPA: hypothetical protein V6C57_19725 [Coleofasciculaceae cyanobacterium]
MSSSRRYQSHLFNFLSRQSMRLRDQTGQAWRQAKTAAVWGAQILLYPLYMGFQTTRLVGKQLRQTARQVLPKLQAAQQRVQPVSDSEPILWSDTPIQRSLQLLDDLSLVLPADRLALQLDPHDPSAPGMMVVVGGSALAQGELPTGQAIALQGMGAASTEISRADGVAAANAIQPAIRIQGIACLLSSRQMVLVSPENQLLDVLSPKQQLILQRRMVGDIATYRRQQQVLSTSQASPLVDRFLPLPKDRPQALPPIRAFWQLMAWVQTSPVAIATNLFQESRLMSPAPAELPRLPGTAALRSAQPTWKTGDEMLSSWSHWFRHRLQDFKNLTLQSAAQPPEKLLDAAATQPWLTKDDLFSQSQPVQGWIARLTAPRSLSTAMTQVPPSGELQNSDLLNPLTQIELAQRAQARQSARSLLSQPPNRTAQPSAGELITLGSPAQEELVANPTWIEAEVRLVTYEQHPIERLLGWIDRGLSWVEHQAAHVWQWLRDRWST